MLKWIKDKIYFKQRKKIKELENKLKELEILYDLKTKHYNSEMVRSEVKYYKLQTIYRKEKDSHSMVMSGRNGYIKELEKTLEGKEELISKLLSENDTLRSTLGISNR